MKAKPIRQDSTETCHEAKACLIIIVNTTINLKNFRLVYSF